MTLVQNRTIALLLGLLLLAGVACFAWWDQPVFILAPFAVLAGLFFVQNPAYLFYALMAAIPWSIEYSVTPTLGTDLPDEPMMLLLSFSVIVLLGRYKYGWKKAMHPLLFLLAAQVLWMLLASVASTDLLLSFKFLLAKSWYLLAFVAAPLIFFRDEKFLVRSVSILLGSMLIFVALALVRHAQNGWTFGKINDSLQPFYRNHVNYSALLVMMVPLQVALIRLTASRSWRRFITVTLIVTLGALYFSYARGAWLALFTGLFAYWAIRKKVLLISFILFFTICFATLGWLARNDRYVQLSGDYRTTIFHTNFREHLIATYELKDMSNAERIYRWVAGVRMAGDGWRTGFGPATFYHQYKPYTVPAFKTWVSRNEEQSTVHNYFLLTLIEQGVPGLILLLLLIGSLFWYAEKIYHRTDSHFWKVVITAAAVVLMMECTVNFLSDLVETDKIGSVFYICLATIIIADRKTRKQIVKGDV